MRRSTPRTASSLPNRFVRPDVSTAQSTPGPAWGLARPAWFTEESLQVSQDVGGRLSRRERPVGDQPALRLSGGEGQIAPAHPLVELFRLAADAVLGRGPRRTLRCACPSGRRARFGPRWSPLP